MNTLFDLSSLAILELRGIKAHDFLQGQLTSDLDQVTETHFKPAALCNLQGRIISLMEVFQFESSYYLILPEHLLEKTQRILTKPAQFSRVEIIRSEKYRILGYYKSDKATPLASVPVLPDEPYTLIAKQEYLVLCLKKQTYLLLTTSTHAEDLLKTNTVLPDTIWHRKRMEQGAIEIYPETSEQFLPHRLNLQETPYLSFNKGCYRGQEIIARTHYRATLKHGLVQYQVHCNEALTPGMAICDEKGNAIGELVDVAALENNQYYITASLLYEHPMTIRFANHTKVVSLCPLPS